jgi:hypothetical protein
MTTHQLRFPLECSEAKTNPVVCPCAAFLHVSPHSTLPAPLKVPVVLGFANAVSGIRGACHVASTEEGPCQQQASLFWSKSSIENVQRVDWSKWSNGAREKARKETEVRQSSERRGTGQRRGQRQPPFLDRLNAIRMNHFGIRFCLGKRVVE